MAENINGIEKVRIMNRFWKRFRHGIAEAFGKRTVSKELTGKTDDALAAWHASKPENSSERILAEQEWQRRLLARQLKGARVNLLIGAAVGALIGTATTIASVLLRR